MWEIRGRPKDRSLSTRSDCSQGLFYFSLSCYWAVNLSRVCSSLRVTWLRNISYWLKEAMRLCVTLFYSQCRVMYVVTCSSLLCAFFLLWLWCRLILASYVHCCSASVLETQHWFASQCETSVFPVLGYSYLLKGVSFLYRCGGFTMEKILWSSPIWSSVVIEPFLIL